MLAQRSTTVMLTAVMDNWRWFIAAGSGGQACLAVRLCAPAPRVGKLLAALVEGTPAIKLHRALIEGTWTARTVGKLPGLLHGSIIPSGAWHIVPVGPAIARMRLFQVLQPQPLAFIYISCMPHPRHS